MRIIALGCIHNDIEKLPFVIDTIKKKKPDVVVSVGDVLDEKFPEGFKGIDIGRIFLTQLKEINATILVTPGTWDKDLFDYYKKEGVFLHGDGVIVNKIGFYGFGGAKTPFNTPYEPSDEEIYEGLKKGYEKVKNSDILVQLTHAPPLMTSLDIIPNGMHVGSAAVRKFIEEKQPDVAICAHIHEGRGIDMIGKTKILNVGKLTEGYLGIVDIESKENIKVDIISFVE